MNKKDILHYTGMTALVLGTGAIMLDNPDDNLDFYNFNKNKIEKNISNISDEATERMRKNSGVKIEYNSSENIAIFKIDKNTLKYLFESIMQSMKNDGNFKLSDLDNLFGEKKAEIQKQGNELLKSLDITNETTFAEIEGIFGKLSENDRIKLLSIIDDDEFPIQAFAYLAGYYKDNYDLNLKYGVKIMNLDRNAGENKLYIEDLLNRVGIIEKGILKQIEEKNSHKISIEEKRFFSEMKNGLYEAYGEQYLENEKISEDYNNHLDEIHNNPDFIKSMRKIVLAGLKVKYNSIEKGNYTGTDLNSIYVDGLSEHENNYIFNQLAGDEDFVNGYNKKFEYALNLFTAFREKDRDKMIVFSMNSWTNKPNGNDVESILTPENQEKLNKIKEKYKMK